MDQNVINIIKQSQGKNKVVRLNRVKIINVKSKAKEVGDPLEL